MLPFDETARSDLAALAEDRRLPEWRRKALADALAGVAQGEGGRANRDLPFHHAAHFLLALALAFPSIGRRGDPAAEVLLDPACASASGLAARLLPVEAAGLSISKDGVTIGAADPPWRAGWASLVQSGDLVAFLMMGDGCLHFPVITACLADLRAAVDKPRAVIEARRALSGAAQAYREAHLPAVTSDAQRLRRLIRHLAERQLATGQRHAAPGDEDVMSFFEAEVSIGERPLFRTTVEIVADFIAAGQLRRAAEGMSEAEEISEAIAAGHDAREEERSDPFEHRATALEWLDALPEQPKFLLKSERQTAAEIASLDPWWRHLPLSLVRLLAVASWQNRLVNELRQDEAAVSPFRPPLAYEDAAGEVAGLAAHFDRLVAVLFAALDPAAEGQADPAHAVRRKQAMVELKAFRRAGFDAPPETLLPLMREAVGPITGLRVMSSDCRDRIARLTKTGQSAPWPEQQDKDAARFERCFRMLYGGKDQGHERSA